MPAAFTRFAPGWRTLGLAVALPTSLAVFSERLIELGETPRIEAELSANLPADPERAAAIVRQRLKQGGTDLQRRIGTAYQGVTDAWSLGVTTIPAVVVDQRFVVYGEPDVARAVARIEQHRRMQP
jgi:integrating conjugative element protein (TIGR03757 family)